MIARLAESVVGRWLIAHGSRVDEAWAPHLWGERLLYWTAYAPYILSSSDGGYRSALLNTLARHAGTVFSKTQLLSLVWGFDGYDSNLVEVHISALRRKLEADPSDPRFIRTERGVGYVFAAAVDQGLFVLAVIGVGLTLIGRHLWAAHLYREARDALARYRLVEARALLGRCLTIWPGDFEVQLAAARTERRLGSYEAAERHLALELGRGDHPIDPGLLLDAQVLVRRMQVLVRGGDRHDAGEVGPVDPQDEDQLADPVVATEHERVVRFGQRAVGGGQVGEESCLLPAAC